eukprot:1271101-Amphidinium_carterae.3
MSELSRRGKECRGHQSQKHHMPEVRVSATTTLHTVGVKTTITAEASTRQQLVVVGVAALQNRETCEPSLRSGKREVQCCADDCQVKQNMEGIKMEMQDGYFPLLVEQQV